MISQVTEGSLATGQAQHLGCMGSFTGSEAGSQSPSSQDKLWMHRHDSLY